MLLVKQVTNCLILLGDKHKISKILKDDRKFIKKQFEGVCLQPNSGYEKEDIVSFFFKNIFQDLGLV